MALRLKRIGTVSALCIAALAAALILLSPGKITRDSPRDLPWVLPDYRLAKTHWYVGEDGRIYAEVEHFFLQGISPPMISWFYRNLPISTIEFKNTSYPLYHIFHPTEHGRIRVLEPASDGSSGMGLGALVGREEWFGTYDSRGAARIVEYSDAGFLAIPEVAGIPFGEVRHIFTPAEGGTEYRVQAVIGSSLPVLGPLLNWYLRHQVFHPQMMEQWQRHQVEEVASLQFFLPSLYAQRDNAGAFVLEQQTP
ncbi:Uncharacterised protein [Halioglobus japonicus]|nr:Uncharacterised protein [Halioglobus japonicus]